MGSRWLAYGWLLGLWACGSNAEEPLLGQWQAFAAEEEGRALEVNLEEIRFHFEPEGTYHFYSTLNHREAGRYERKQDHLLTRDTMQPDAGTKTVRIARLEADTLVLEMREADRDRTLSLVRLP